MRVEVDGLDVAVVRHGDEVFAIEDECSHAAVALSEGDVDDCTIECWMHGSRFDLRSRGIEEAEARRLVVHGFFNDLIRKIGVPELEQQLVSTVEAELEKNVGRITGATATGEAT